MLKETVRYQTSINESSSSNFVEVRNPYNQEVVANIEQVDASTNA